MKRSCVIRKRPSETPPSPAGWGRGAFLRRFLLVLAGLGISSLVFATVFEARSGLLTVRYRDVRDRSHLEFVFRTWQETVRDLERIGLVAKPTRLEAYSSAAEFSRATGEPWFVAASTLGDVIRTQRLSALRQRGLLLFTIRHEAFHTVQPSRLPRWLAEGLARTFSGEYDRDPQTPTGLESVSDEALEALLLARTDQAKLDLAYREATRRAARLVRERGWKAVLTRWK